MNSGPLLAISPHLDDAVFGCADLLAARPGAVVVSVFAGTPPDQAVTTDWDAACGFRSAGEALAARRREDDAALALLQASAWRMDFPDDQYRAGGAVDVGALAQAMRTALRRHRPDTVAIPLGLFHRDHRLCHEAVLHLCAYGGDLAWLAYEDAIYRRFPGLVQERLARLAAAGFVATPAASPGRCKLKRRAVRCYASQLRGLAAPGRPGTGDTLAPERYWAISPRGRVRA